MRAMAIDGFGTAPTPHDLPAPVPDKGEIRVQVLVASLNGFDLDAVGPGVTEFVPGESVFGVLMKPELGDGTFAELVAAPEKFHPSARKNSTRLMHATPRHSQTSGIFGWLALPRFSDVTTVRPSRSASAMTNGSAAPDPRHTVCTASTPRSLTTISTMSPGPRPVWAFPFRPPGRVAARTPG